MAQENEISAPFGEDIALRLNAYQLGVSGIFSHPFTCANSGDGRHPSNEITGVLVATPDGWRCPFCEYEQDWAWRIMAGDALGFLWEKIDAPESLGFSERQETAILKIRTAVEQRICLAGAKYRKLLGQDGVNLNVVEAMLKSIGRLAGILKEYREIAR